MELSAYDLDGKVALVTGAARGIGLETARALHERGSSVALVDLDAAATEAAATTVGARALGLGADVSEPEAIGAAVEATVQRFGGLDVCVANAGISPAASTVRAAATETFERVIEVNLLGTYRTVRAALPHVIAGGGHLSLVSSIYAFMNGVFVAAYGATKTAVEGLGRALRVELAQHEVSVGVVYYGFVATEMVREGFESDPLAARVEEQLAPRFVRRRLSAREAAEALVRGVERRAPRVFAPGYLRAYSALRGLINPLLDRRLEHDATLQALLREADLEGRTAGREIVAARAPDAPPRPDVR
jgi:NAD(P)-dependent dehydrogenase (short-subunit alcohol dehydrogenase family)